MCEQVAVCGGFQNALQKQLIDILNNLLYKNGYIIPIKLKKYHKNN